MVEIQKTAYTDKNMSSAVLLATLDPSVDVAVAVQVLVKAATVGGTYTLDLVLTDEDENVVTIDSVQLVASATGNLGHRFQPVAVDAAATLKVYATSSLTATDTAMAGTVWYMQMAASETAVDGSVSTTVP